MFLKNLFKEPEKKRFKPEKWKNPVSHPFLIKIAAKTPVPNARVKLADFLARNSSWEYFPGHRGDFHPGS